MGGSHGKLMNIDLIVNEIILRNNTLSDEERDEIIYELIDIYSRMPNPVKDVGVITFINLSDKELILTLISAYEADAIRHFLLCGREPSKFEY
jgi:hypothetical protein